MPKFIVGDLLTGLRLQFVPVVDGSWSEELNGAGKVSCTVDLRDPAIRRLDLANSATAGKTYLGALEGTEVLQAGPIWSHVYDRSQDTLTFEAEGMWSYFEHRLILPYGVDPETALADTRFTDVVVGSDDPADDWPLDTRTSYQGVICALHTQALAWPAGGVPLNVPSPIAGTDEFWEKGASLTKLGTRVRDITRLQNGPDVQYKSKLNSQENGLEWDLRIGTPTNPELASPLEHIFSIGTPRGSVSKFKVEMDASAIASMVYVSGGRSEDRTLIESASSSALTDADFPLLDLVDSSHTSVVIDAQLAGFADELISRSVQPIATITFDHELTRLPAVTAFTVGDYAKLKIRGDHYLANGTYRARIISREGDAEGRTVSIGFQPDPLGFVPDPTPWSS